MINFINNFYLFLFLIFGLCIGSFINVVIYRYPLILKQQFDDSEDNLTENINLSFPLSHCPNCKQPILKRDNIPVISWLLLKGRCRNCNIQISLRYMFTELFFGIVFLLSYVLLHPAYSIAFIISILALISCLYCIFFIDLKSYFIPDPISYFLIWLGLALSCLKIIPITPLESVFGAIVVWGIISITGYIFHFIKGIEGIGQGDYKLFAVGGIWLGIFHIHYLIIASSLFGILFYLINKTVTIFPKPSDKYFDDLEDVKEKIIPFGPSICLAILTNFIYFI